MESQASEKMIDLPMERRTAIEREMRRRLGQRIQNFGLLIRDQGLVLSGRSNTYYAKQLAQHIIMEATDLPILANEIEVD